MQLIDEKPWQPHPTYGYELKAKPLESLSIEEKAKLMFEPAPELPPEVKTYLDLEQRLYKTKQSLKQVKAVKKFIAKPTRKRKRSMKPSQIIRTKTNQLAESVQSFFANESAEKKEEIAQILVNETIKKNKHLPPTTQLISRSRSRGSKLPMTRELADRFLKPISEIEAKVKDPVTLLNQRTIELNKQKANLTSQLRQCERVVESWLKQQPKQEFLLQNGKLRLKQPPATPKPRSIALAPAQFKESIAIGLMRANMKDPKAVKQTVEQFADYVSTAGKLQKMEIAR